MDGTNTVQNDAIEARADTAPPRKIFIRDLELMASVGIYSHEHEAKQRLLINMELLVHDAYDGASDRIFDVYDYDNAIRVAQGVADSGHINLIETFAERIATGCLAHESVFHTRVRIEKPDVKSAARSVGIEIERTRHR